ncbi:serine/threonine-protein kinase HAL4/sat4 [Podila clonocystis]|nr:serine/threonine-protein kinase HAL4/sat4 [Podila clonocystis]
MQIGPSTEGRDKWKSCPTFALTPVEDQVDIRDDDAVNVDDEGQTENKGDRVHNNENENSSDTRLSTEETTQSLAVIDPAVTLRSSVARSTSVISATSASGRPRLTHRLSYLASVQNMDVDEEEKNHARPLPLNQDARKEKEPLPASSSKSAGELETSSFVSQRHDIAHQRGTNAASQPPSSPLPCSTVIQSLAHVESGRGRGGGPHQRQSSSPQSSSVSTPPIPKLYKRLLRLFNPPTDSSDSDTGMAVHPDATPETTHGRGSFGLGQPTPESIGFNTRRVTAGINPPKSTRKPHILPPVSQKPLPPKDASNKPPELHLGFKARLLKKLMSSPNLNSNSSIAPMDQSVPAGSSRDSTSTFSRDCDDNQQVRYDSPISPTPLDFEHESSCPVGQRIRASCEGARPRASTLPRSPAPMPTLQSKYGVPGRELGAGTQAQVMLLRVKSTKRIRSTQQSSKRPPSSTQAATISSNDTERVLSPRLLSPDDNALLTPRAASGTLTTTFEEDVTPEQREAYRKKLLRRTSTGALSAMSVSSSGGLIYAIKKFRPPRATETHRQYLKKVCAEFCISTSMDHENIIRTIDLVRDQPGQELLDENQEETTGNWARGLNTWESKKRFHGDRSGYQRTGHPDSAESSSRGNSVPYDDREGPLFEDECLDCNCPRVLRSSSGRVRTIRSAGDLRGQTKHLRDRTSAAREAVITLSQRKPVKDANSYNVNGSRRVSEASQGSSQPSMASGRSYQHDQNHPVDLSRKSGLNSNEVKKRKQQQQQLEHEMRLRELQRLKQQKQQEKDQAKQPRLDQFPEYCMVMEFAAGGDLFNLLTRSYPPISLHEKQCLWRQLVSGIQYMHSMGVAHRDLKPENILIDASGRILKITDFGIANVFKSVGDPNPLPCRGIIGSEPYIAPEEFHQEEYDPRAVDVWACGIIFYVMYYAAMPWARADRKKDGRYARFFNDIMIYRQTEGQRRSQFERQQLYTLRPGVNKQGGQAQYGSSINGNTSSSDMFISPHHISNHRQFPPFNFDAQATSQNTRASNDSSLAGSFTSQHSQDSTDTGLSSVQGSPVEQTATPLSAYNTYGYNQHLGGHEFIDRIETVGCRRVLYAILDPEPKRRLTIDQVANDEWVQQIRYCTDEIVKQEQQTVMHVGKGVPSSKYLTLAIGGQQHHQHAVPKKVKH